MGLQKRAKIEKKLNQSIEKPIEPVAIGKPVKLYQLNR